VPEQQALWDQRLLRRGGLQSTECGVRPALPGLSIRTRACADGPETFDPGSLPARSHITTRPAGTSKDAAAPTADSR
jgi:hypothetical protein